MVEKLAALCFLCMAAAGHMAEAALKWEQHKMRNLPPCA
jgi:hypothetical protein